VVEKQQTKVLTPGAGGKPAGDGKSRALNNKQQKNSAQAAQPKKRRFTFFNDVIAELKKVTWPTRQETIRLTLIVIGMCLVMGALLGIIDYGFSELVAKVFLSGK
jgi:preprotein translocase subunit SecE